MPTVSPMPGSRSAARAATCPRIGLEEPESAIESAEGTETARVAASVIEPEPEVESAIVPVVRGQITDLAAREEIIELGQAERIALVTVTSRAALAVETVARLGVLRDSTDRVHAPATTAGLRVRNPGAAVPGAVAVP